MLEDTNQRVHDYRQLVRRWRSVARGAGLEVEEFARQDAYPVYCLRTRGSLEGGLYLSSGIHGDEPAGPEALVYWAEKHLRTHLRSSHPVPLLILPCLNPWGVVNNQRMDHRGRDLNRIFDRRNVSPIKELKRLITGIRFAAGVALHEDYDARGIYLYELNALRPDWGQSLLRACESKSMPVDPRRRIDDWPFRAGVMLRRRGLERLPLHPEAIHLCRHHHTRRFYTFETPSEFSLAKRVKAQVRLVEKCLEHLKRLPRAKTPSE